MDKNYIRMIQGFEQASAMLKPFANLIGVYFKNLVESGFTRQEALVLVESYQAMIFNKSFEINDVENRHEEDQED